MAITQVKKKGLLDTLTFGKWKGRTVEYVLDVDPDYLLWVDEHIEWFKIETEILNDAIEGALAKDDDDDDEWSSWEIDPY